MVSSNNTIFGAHPASQFVYYGKDRHVKPTETTYTTFNGAPVAHPCESQRSGFHGFSECTAPIPGLSSTNLFWSKGKDCSVTVRFFNARGESCSYNIAQDLQGFVVKFQTEEGIWDLVCNTPIFLGDHTQFPHFIHVQKCNWAANHTHADDCAMFWDCLRENTESIHHVMILVGDRGILDTLRDIHGYSGHTFRMINKSGTWVYVQVHLTTQQGTGFVAEEEEDESPSMLTDHSQNNLHEAIGRGDYSIWSIELETMPPKEAETTSFLPETRRQAAVIYEVDPDIPATREQGPGYKGHDDDDDDGIASLGFNGAHSGMAVDERLGCGNEGASWPHGTEGGGQEWRPGEGGPSEASSFPSTSQVLADLFSRLGMNQK